MENKYTETPFDKIILELSQETFKNLENTKPNQTLILQHLQTLRTVYLMMKEIDFYLKVKNLEKETVSETITFQQAILQSPLDSYKSRFLYFLFLTLLNQFYRAIRKHISEDIADKFPNNKRIKFYRDKVIEHWEAYIDYFPSDGLTFQEGQIAIPIVEKTIAPSDREEQRKKLISEFSSKDIHIDIKNSYNCISSNSQYSNSIYQALENLCINFHKKSGEEYKEIINILFQFGFPAPICDIEEYSETLIQYTRTILSTPNSK